MTTPAQSPDVSGLVAELRAGLEGVPSDLDGLVEFYSAYADEISERLRAIRFQTMVRTIVAQAIMRDREITGCSPDNIARLLDALQAAEGRVKVLEEALTEIAQMQTSEELTKAHGVSAVVFADFEAGYDDCVEAARTALQGAK